MTRRTTEAAKRLSQAFGSRVAELRAERKWTQKQLANATWIDQGFVSRIEAGLVEPCLGTLATLAKAFEMSLSDLLKGV